MVSFALVESGYLLGSILGKVSFQNLREHYDHSELLNLWRGFNLFMGGSAWQGHPGDVPNLKVAVDLSSHWDM